MAAQRFTKEELAQIQGIIDNMAESLDAVMELVKARRRPSKTDYLQIVNMLTLAVLSRME